MKKVFVFSALGNSSRSIQPIMLIIPTHAILEGRKKTFYIECVTRISEHSRCVVAGVIHYRAELRPGPIPFNISIS
jgi:hypothetical protein